MPRITGDMETHKLGGSFTFSAARIERLGATEYTLVTVAVDATGSVLCFKKQLRDMLVASVDSCKKSPRSDNLLVRVFFFSSAYPSGISEVHGFKPLAEIDTASYPEIETGGDTPLYDACYSGVGAMNAYAKQLVNQDFNVNGICFVVTDGGENASVATVNMVKNELEKSVTGEILESMISVLIGINTQGCGQALQDFRQDTGITHYRDAGDATPRNLAKLAGFVSQSVSSQSQALGTGGPSQNIAPTI